MLQFGRELRWPIDLLLGRPKEAVPTHSYNDQVQQSLEQVHRFARENLQLASDKMKGYYDLHADNIVFEAGDAVWLHNPQRRPHHSPKLMRAWEGPYTVIKAINDVVYHIQLTPQSKPKLIHHNLLWEYTDDSKPSWFKSSNHKTAATTVPNPTTTNNHLPNSPISNAQAESEAESIMNVTRLPRQKYSSLQYNLDIVNAKGILFNTIKLQPQVSWAKNFKEGSSVMNETND